MTILALRASFRLVFSGLLLGYIIVGSVCWSVMVSGVIWIYGSLLVTTCTKISLGEMVSYLPVPGGHIKLSERFVDPGRSCQKSLHMNRVLILHTALSFAMGWNYW